MGRLFQGKKVIKTIIYCKTMFYSLRYGSSYFLTFIYLFFRSLFNVGIYNSLKVLINFDQ